MTLIVKAIYQQKYNNSNPMKKIPNIILFVLKPRTTFVPSTANHHQVVNKILCYEEDLPHYKMSQYIDKEMQNYPISKDTPKKVVRDQHISKHNKSTGMQLIKFAHEFVSKSNYLLLQETRELLNRMSEADVEQNEINLQMLRKSIYECMSREQLGEHASTEIRILLFELGYLQKGKLSR